MIDIINTLCALLTIGFGLFGFVAPRYTASALDLEPTKSTMGLSEMRASVGGLFVVAGLAALWLDDPVAYAMIGFAFVGARNGSGFVADPRQTTCCQSPGFWRDRSGPCGCVFDPQFGVKLRSVG